MSIFFEELDYQPTPMGALTLRRRREMSLGVDVYEIKLGEEHLMSSLFTASEIALARLGLADLSGDDLDVVVGGLGLGYTANEVLDDARVRSLIVVEALDAVISWHVDGLLPLGRRLTADPRCRLTSGDFFRAAASGIGFDAECPGRLFDAVIVDIDHSPEFLLDPGNADFYEHEGLVGLSAHLKPDGLFALWSNDLPDRDFVGRLAGAFVSARAELVTFNNPLRDNEFTQTVYIARKKMGG